MLPTPRFVLASLTALLLVPCCAAAQPARDRVAASFVLAVGRTPTPAEIDEWTAANPASVADLFARHRRQIEANPAVRRAVMARAGEDAFGVTPGEDEAATRAGAGTYVEVVQRHLAWLAEHPADYERVVNRAYRRTLQRDAYSIEVEYWKRRPLLSFALLAACVEDWARRNQPGLMATTGLPTASINNVYLATVRLSPAIAAEVRAVAGLADASHEALDLAAGRTVLAPGAGQVISPGGIHFAAAGAPGLVSTPSAAR